MRRAFSLALEVELRWRCYRTRLENGDGPAMLWIAAGMTEMRREGGMAEALSWLSLAAVVIVVDARIGQGLAGDAGSS